MRYIDIINYCLPHVFMPSHASVVVMLSSLEFDMNGLTNDMKNKSKLSERPNIYDYNNYIQDEIENIKSITLIAEIHVAPFTGMHQLSP